MKVDENFRDQEQISVHSRYTDLSTNGTTKIVYILVVVDCIIDW